MIILGNRVPYEYFMTKGKGESDAGSEGLPYEMAAIKITYLIQEALRLQLTGVELKDNTASMEALE
jgi:hypothetical protein